MKIKLQRKQFIIGGLIIALSSALYYSLKVGNKSITIKKGTQREVAARKLAGLLNLQIEEDEETLTIGL